MPSCLRLPFRLVACGLALFSICASARAGEEPPHSAELDAAIIAQAKRHGVPEKLVRRIVMRESRYNARARNHSFWGLMQISYPTAKSMGFKGSPEDLLNPFVNLTYAVPYLANAFIIAGKQEDAAVRLYAAGYYLKARSRGLLGALRTADSKPLSGVQDMPQFASAQTPQDSPFVTPSLAPLPQDVASATPLPEHRPGILPDGKKIGDGVAMVVARNGDATPPKKWTHDGGVTLIARGEQPVEQIAAFGQAPGIEAKGAPGAARRHAKSTMFAAIYMPASAQAYAPSPVGQDPQLAQTPAQAAISQMSARSADAASDIEPRPRGKKSHSRASRKDNSTDEANAADDEAPKSRSKRRSTKAQAVAAEEPETVKNPDAR